jgi:putative redox protein
MDVSTAPTPPNPAPLAQSAEARAVETRQGPLQVEIQTGPSRFFSDEPVNLGGGNTGPTPHELVCAGLAACTAQTVRMYADRKGWPLERIEVDVHETRSGKGPTQFARTIRFHGSLDAAQISRLLEIADHCPVHRTLSEGAVITTQLETAEA